MSMRVNRILVTSCAAVVAAGLAGLPAAATAETYEALYKACFSSGMPDQVIASCSVVIGQRLAEGEDLATAFKNRGNAYNDQGDYAHAIEDYGQALATNPQDSEAFNSRGATFTALGQYDRAVADFDQAVRLNPASPQALGNRCFAKALLGQLEAALADCNEALRLKPGNAALASRAFVHLKARRIDAAIADYNAHLGRRPEDPYALFGRDLARYPKGDNAGADRDIAAARSLKSDIEEQMAKLGLKLQDFRQS
jgi:tetratricopeptide (TPR) repeat protein